MNQVTCYLYEYKHNQKTRNVGFVKLQKQGTRLRMYIHGNRMDVKTEECLQVYLFQTEKDQCNVVQLGHIKGKNDGVNCVVDTEVGGLPKGYSFEQMDGAIFEQENGNKYVAAWKAVAVNVDHMMIVQEIEEKEEKQTCEEEQEEIEILHQQDIDPICQPKVQCKKIKRQDISQLPRKEWKLANNSFLLHGYYNYNHLVFIEEQKEKEEEQLWLGVPGVFHEKEASAAKAFGFSEFKKIDIKELTLTDKERNSSDEFGYWCRQIHRL